MIYRIRNRGATETARGVFVFEEIEVLRRFKARSDLTALIRIITKNSNYFFLNCRSPNGSRVSTSTRDCVSPGYGLRPRSAFSLIIDDVEKIIQTESAQREKAKFDGSRRRELTNVEKAEHIAR